MRAETTVVVVDDHPLYRRGVVETVSAAPDIRVVGEAATADHAVVTAEATKPDIVLLDLGIPGGGLEAARLISARLPQTRIVVLTASEAQHDVDRALEIGARGYVLKGVSADDLVGVIRRVSLGEAYVTPSLAAAMLMTRNVALQDRSGSDPVGDLTPREHEVLELVAEAFSNKEIAARLSISEKTVKHHVTNILDKLQARNRVEAALLARGETTNHGDD
jgi:two-component system nitrate/nitrite response regulator NarL